MSVGKQMRMKRIQGEDGKILMVAMDHAAIGGPMEGLESPLEALQAVVEGSPDSILLTRGMLGHGWEAIPPHVGLVMRISGVVLAWQIEPAGPGAGSDWAQAGR